MSFELPDQTVTLTFEGTAFEGAEATARVNVSMEQFMKLDEIEGQEGVPGMVRYFGQHLLQSWNVTMNKKPVPATADGMAKVSLVFALMIVQQWREAITSPNGPLGRQLKSGDSEADLNLGSSSTLG